MKIFSKIRSIVKKYKIVDSYLSRKYINIGKQSDLLNEEPYRKMIQKNSLLRYYGNIHSQRGQDSILQEIFRRIGIEKGNFIEFGAFDGIYLSNSRYLFELGWGGCLLKVIK